MGFQAIISAIASIVSIVGGVVGIISAVSKEPVFTRLWQRQLQVKSPSALQPLPSVPTPIGTVASPTRAEDQSRRILPTSKSKPGIVYGLVLGVLALMILLGIQTLYLQTPSFAILGYIALGVLSIAAGVLPARASGSLLSAVIAGSILGIFCFLTAVGYSLLNPDIVYTGNASIWLTFFVVFGVVPFMVSMLFGLLGRHLYKRLQVSVPNVNAPTTINPVGAQQLHQARQSSRQVSVQGNCPYCGFSLNPPGAKFCSNCGRNL